MHKVLISLVVLLLFVGCGVNKEYVADQISASEAKTNAEIAGLSDKTDLNASELAKLRSLASQIEEKADLAIDKAEGFENYQIIWTGEILFAYDSYEIDGVAGSVLDDCGAKLESSVGSLLEVAGHTDISGSAKYNLMLGDKRATSARRYLADRFGISLYRMFTVSHGEEKPVAMPDEQNASSKNRRVKLTVWGEM